MKNGILIACHRGLKDKMINHIHSSVDEFMLNIFKLNFKFSFLTIF